MDKRLEKIIEMVRYLKEDGMGGGAVASGPTMSTGSTAGKAGFGGSAQGFDAGPTAGYDKGLGKVDLRRKIMKRLSPEMGKFIKRKLSK
jgi:hypothetical protein